MTEAVLEALGEKVCHLERSEESPESLCHSERSEESPRPEERPGDPSTRPDGLAQDDKKSCHPEQAQRAEGSSPDAGKDPSTACLRNSASLKGLGGVSPPSQDDRKELAPDYHDHFASLCAQAEALREEVPDFDLGAALRDPAFLRLTAPALGVGVREAWAALHRGEIESRAARRGAEEARRQLALAAASGSLRPREGGGLGAAALTRSDYRALSREAQQSLKRRILDAAARGEKVYP